MPDFAQHASPLIQFLIGLGCCLWIYNEVRKALGKNNVPQPLSVVLKESFVERAAYDRDQSILDKRLTSATASRKQLHTELSAVDKRVGRCEEQGKSQTDTLNLLSADFREFTREQRAVNKELLKSLHRND